MKTWKYLSFAVVSAGLIFTSCSKEQGCTDSTATNYSETAEEDDGSCVYPKTAAEKLEGTWSFSMTQTESKDSAGVSLGSESETMTGTMVINADGSSTLTFSDGGDTESIPWTATDDTVTLTVPDGDTEGETMELKLDIETNTETKQVWTAMDSYTEDGVTETFKIEITLTK